MTSTLFKPINSSHFSEFLRCGFIVQKPNSDLFILGVGETDKHTRSAYFFHHNFYSTKKVLKWPKLLCELSSKELLDLIKSHIISKINLKIEHDFDEQYKTDVVQCVDWISSNLDIDKLVAVTKAVYIDIGEGNSHPLASLEELLTLNGSVYGSWKNGKGVLGVSPEPLFYSEKGGTNSQWQTLALAGTISTDKDDYETVILNDKKESQEHRLVVQDLTEKLETFSDDIIIGKTHCFTFGPIAHLRTYISFIPYDSTLSDRTISKVISALSPSSALGGYPSKNTEKYLKRLAYFDFDEKERSFGGVYGMMLEDEVFSFVGIRNIQWENGKYEIHSGGGIVESSQVLKECVEINNKRDAIYRIFSHE